MIGERQTSKLSKKIKKSDIQKDVRFQLVKKATAFCVLQNPPLRGLPSAPFCPLGGITLKGKSWDVPFLAFRGYGGRPQGSPLRNGEGRTESSAPMGNAGDRKGRLYKAGRCGNRPLQIRKNVPPARYYPARPTINILPGTASKGRYPAGDR